MAHWSEGAGVLQLIITLFTTAMTPKRSNHDGLPQPITHRCNNPEPQKCTRFLQTCLDLTRRCSPACCFSFSADAPCQISLQTSSRAEAENHQPESLFFNRLPLEIRLLIYEYVFQDHNLTHVYFFQSYLPVTPHPGYSGFASHLWYSCLPAIYPTRALLQTCRRVYQEGLQTAIDSRFLHLRGPLDQSTTLMSAFKNPHQFPVHQFGNICHLAIRWVYGVTAPSTLWKPYCMGTETAQWQQLWAMIADNTRLKSLEVNLMYVGPANQMHLNASWLKPVTQVKGVKCLKIDVRHCAPPRQAQHALNEELYGIMIAPNRRPYVLMGDRNAWQSYVRNWCIHIQQ